MTYVIAVIGVIGCGWAFLVMAWIEHLEKRIKKLESRDSSEDRKP